jgi:tRNA modification GTPase
MHLPDKVDTICALATAPGVGAIAVIRISGNKAFEVGSKIFQTKKGTIINFNEVKTHTLHFGNIVNEFEIIDEVLVSVFKNPNSYTGDDTLEISCHGSTYIQQKILEEIQKNGIRLATAGEFTLRAFLNGKLDLTQAEAVGDLIAAEHASAHKTAIQQLRGGYQTAMRELRQQLMDFASLLELELDFAEEDVEFANREQLKILIQGLLIEVNKLLNSFSTGNALKSGIPVVIAGKPNVGKSTLLNTFLNEEKAIVSDIAGTTRDVVEDQLVISGYRFRFIDTAGLRKTEDQIEKIGVERTYAQTEKASIILYLCDPGQSTPEEALNEIKALKIRMANEDAIILTIVNKTDQYPAQVAAYSKLPNAILISAKEKINIELLKERLLKIVKEQEIAIEGQIVTNARHASSLKNAAEALQKVIAGIENNLSTDLLAFELKTSLYHLGEITGEIYTDDLLGNIFSRFCIGK